MRTRRAAGAILAIASLSARAVLGSVPLPLHDDLSQPTSSPSPRLFPLLSWIRDEAIEIIFGRPPKRLEPIDSGFRIPSLARYADEVVLRFNVTTPVETMALADSADRLFLDVWAATEDFVDIRIRKDRVPSLLRLLPETLHDAHRTLIRDVAAAVYGTYPSSADTGRHTAASQLGPAPLRPAMDEGDNVFFRDYRPLPVIVPWMKLMEAMFPSIARVISIGSSYEGKDIPALKLGISRVDETTHPRKTLVVTGGLHAREWISTSTVNYVAWSFVSNYGRERMITKLLEHFDVIFIPVMNPDGVDYTWQVDRLWRKSRQQTGMRLCRGLDLDHAFGFEWDTSGVSHDPCSESYGGSEPWEAVEALALADWARNQTRNHNVKFVGLIDLHSYSQQVLFPFAYTCHVDPPNRENLEELAVGLSKAIRLSSGESYSVTSACKGATFEAPRQRSRAEAGGGSAIDWFFHELGAHFSYQIKLRDTGSYGFLLPKEHIIPTGEEIFHAMKYLGDYLLGNNGIERAAGREEVLDSLQDSDRGSELRRVRRRP